MGKSLREALEEQMALLQSRGLAPEELPEEGEHDGFEAPTPNGRSAPSSAPRRLAARGPKRGGASSRPADEPISREPRVRGGRARSRPPGIQRRGPPQTASREPMRAPSVGAVLQRRVQQRRQEERREEQLVDVLSEVVGRELGPEEVKRFLSDLERETGVLPPIEVAVAAIREANSIEPKQVGEAIRQYYRRPRVGLDSSGSSPEEDI